MHNQTKEIAQSINYIEIALIQLDRAIDLYNDKDFICSTTLAGAAEEVLGRILKEANIYKKKTIFLYNKGNNFRDFLVEKGISKSSKEAIKTMNLQRDSFKHFKPEICEGSFDAKTWCFTLISRAIINIQYMFDGEFEIENLIKPHLARKIDNFIKMHPKSMFEKEETHA